MPGPADNPQPTELERVEAAEAARQRVEDRARTFYLRPNEEHADGLQRALDAWYAAVRS